MLIFARQSDAFDMVGVAVEQSWTATDDLTGVEIQKCYPITETEAVIKADLTALFPANPVVSQDRLESLKVLKAGNTYKIVDENGKPLLTIKRDELGNANVDVVDVNGNVRRILTPQAGTMKLDSTATIADVTFDQTFTEQPIVNVTPSKSLPNYDLNVTKTGFTMDFATAPASTIAWEAKTRRK